MTPDTVHIAQATLDEKDTMKHLLLSLTVFTVLTVACTPKSEDKTLARCDRIADKKIKFFANQDNSGTVRQTFLSSCVLGPDKTYTEHGQTWVDCMDTAVTGAELSNCQKGFDHAIKTDKLAEVRAAIEAGVKAYLCDSPSEDVVKEHEDKIEALRDEAKALGAEESEIPTISNVTDDLDKTTLCTK